MRQIQVNVYTFNELSEAIQDKVIKDFSEANYIDDFWYSSTLDYWNDKLDSLGFSNAEISFSGFNSQGDGASFKADCDGDKLYAKYWSSEIVHRRVDIAFEKRSNHRYFDYAIYIYFLTDREELNEDELAFKRWLKERYYDLCKEIYRDLQAEYDHITSEEYILEHINGNEYEFYANGEVV